ncbi:MAG: phosphonate metabolism transcriptional regulator PhnF [Pseudomonadota bacterium]
MGRPSLWKDISEILEREIRSGVLTRGDQLPTESSLAERFAVNRHTVRRALSHLTEIGLIFTKQGAGAFVAGSVTHYPIGKRVRFHQSVEAVGRHPTKRILHSDTRPANDEEAVALQLETGATVHVAESLAFINDVPALHAVTTFDAKRFPRMLEELGKKPSISAAFAAHGTIDFTRASTQVTAVLANTTSASLLHIAPGAPLLRTQSISIDNKGVPVEFGLTWWAGDRVTLDIEGS